MALLMNVATEYGVDATYWNIGAYADDFKGAGGQITVYGYASEEARRLGRQPLAAGHAQVAGADYAPGMTREQLYVFLKTQPGFSGAIDA